MNKQQEALKIANNITYLVENCTQNFTKENKENLEETFKLTIEQFKFWEKQGNIDRQIYDLRNFGIWLCDYISDVERNFWGE